MASSTTDRRLGLTGGAAIKVPCKAATTSNLTLSGEQTVDGVSCTAGDRVLVKNQTSSVDNGIYVCDTGTWTRDLDFDGSADAVTGTLVMVINGSTNSNTYWRVTTTGTITFGSSAITFAAALASDATAVAFVQSGTGATTRTVLEKLREGALLSVKDYGALVDGATDDSIAVQKCHDAAYAAGRGMFYPSGTCYQASKILYKGVPIYGEGVGKSIIKGGAGKDVFYAPDPTTSESGSLTSFTEHMVVRDLTIKIDNSLALSLPTNFNRPVFPVIAWASTTAYSKAQWVTNSTGKVYFCIVAGTSSSSEPTHTAGYATDGTAVWGYIEAAQIYLGNAAFAFPSSNGAGSTDDILHAEFKNVRIEVTGTSYANHACAIFSQRPFYDCRFEDVVARFTRYGLANIPPTSNFASFEYAPDASTFQKCEMFCVYPLFIYNAIQATVSSFQAYASSSGDRNIYLLEYKSLNRNRTSGCSFSSFYCEGNAATSGVMGHIMGEHHSFNGGAIKSDTAAGYISWWADNSEVSRSYLAGDDTNAPLRIYGNQNVFRLKVHNFANSYSDLGFGNRVELGAYDGNTFISDRPWLLNKARLPANQNTGDFAVHGLAATPFVNFADLWITPGDIKWEIGTQYAITFDTTLESGHYVTIPANGNGFFSTLNRVPATIGTRIPKCKCRFYIKIRAASGTPTQGLQIFAGSTVRGSKTMSLTTSWQVIYFDVDFDLASNTEAFQPTFASTSTNVAVDVAWMAVRPIPVDIVPLVGADVGNAAKALTVGTDEQTQVWSTAISADRAVTLSTTGAYNGARFRILRKATCTGAFNINVGTGPLKAMGTPGSFCDVEYHGATSAWILTAYGTL